MNNINWILRLKNKATLLSLAVCVVGFVYQVLAIFNVVPAISQDMVVQLIGLLVNLLVALGVVVDPTTSGVSDSAQAMTYTAPKQDASIKLED